MSVFRLESRLKSKYDRGEDALWQIFVTINALLTPGAIAMCRREVIVGLLRTEVLD